MQKGFAIVDAAIAIERDKHILIEMNRIGDAHVDEWTAGAHEPWRRSQKMLARRQRECALDPFAQIRKRAGLSGDQGRIKRARGVEAMVGHFIRPIGARPVGNASARPQARYILNTPNCVSSTGALSVAENASASTRRVSDGRITPSSHIRAVA